MSDIELLRLYASRPNGWDVFMEGKVVAGCCAPVDLLNRVADELIRLDADLEELSHDMREA